MGLNFEVIKNPLLYQNIEHEFLHKGFVLHILPYLPVYKTHSFFLNFWLVHLIERCDLCTFLFFFFFF